MLPIHKISVEENLAVEAVEEIVDKKLKNEQILTWAHLCYQFGHGTQGAIQVGPHSDAT